MGVVMDVPDRNTNRIMEFQKDIAPPSAPAAPTPVVNVAMDSDEPSKFSQMLHAVEAHRNKVRIALGIALVARLLFEFKFVSLLRSTENLIVQVPYIGLAMISYLLVLMWMAARTRDRFGFGMALGIGVIESAYLIGMAALERPFNIMTIWPPLVVAAAHIPMAVFAIKSATAYPPQDTKRPWLVGFITALVFLAIPWMAPVLIDAMKVAP
jgi:FtsH-binding integral membrane protein